MGEHYCVLGVVNPLYGCGSFSTVRIGCSVILAIIAGKYHPRAIIPLRQSRDEIRGLWIATQALQSGGE